MPSSQSVAWTSGQGGEGIAKAAGKKVKKILKMIILVMLSGSTMMLTLKCV